MTARPRPPAEVDITEGLVRRLLMDQHPDLADLPIVEVAAGWDCAVYRLGPDLAVRLPRRSEAAAMVLHEQTWLPRIGPGLPLPTPVPALVGSPGESFPWTWSVVPYLEGETAFPVERVDSEQAAEDLGGFLAALHRPAPPEAPRNPYRGIPLAERARTLEGSRAILGGSIDQSAVGAIWREALSAQPWTGPALWLHGDLHPANILVLDGRISGVIDFVDITAGDPSTDLAVGWMLLDNSGRARLREVYEASACYDVRPDDWVRARGWALNHSLACLAHSADDHLIAEIGRHTMAEVLSD